MAMLGMVVVAQLLLLVEVVLLVMLLADWFAGPQHRTNRELMKGA